MKTKNKKISMSKAELFKAWLTAICRRGYCEEYIGFSSVDFFEAVDDLDATEEFNFET